MKLSFDHSGVPVAEKREGMRCAEPMKLWVSNPADSPDGVEHLYFEEGSPAPEIMKTHRHVAFVTDNLDEAAAWCDEVILGPFEDTPEQNVMFARKDDALIEFCCRKKTAATVSLTAMF